MPLCTFAFDEQFLHSPTQPRAVYGTLNECPVVLWRYINAEYLFPKESRNVSNRAFGTLLPVSIVLYAH